MECIPLDRLLHVTEFASVISVAYLGLDKIGNKEEEIHRFTRRVTRIFDGLYHRLDPIDGDGILKESFDSDELYIIAEIAGRRELPEPNQGRALNVKLWYKKNCPLFKFFYSRKDFKVGLGLCAISLITFVGFDWASVTGWCPPDVVVHLTFIYCVAACGWLFYSVYAARKIFNLMPHFEEVKLKIEKRLRRLKQEHVPQRITELEAETERLQEVRDKPDEQ